MLEPGVSALGGTARASTAGGAKAIFSRLSRAAGRFFYLNLCMQDYDLLRAEKTAPGFKFNGMAEQEYTDKYGAPTGGEALRLAVADILDEMIGENPLRVKWSAGAQARGLKRQRFDIGNGAAFYAIMPLADAGGDDTKPEVKGAPLAETAAVEVNDGTAHSWYDMRHGEFLGTADVAKIKLEPNRPALMAALPYTVEKIALESPPHGSAARVQNHVRTRRRRRNPEHHIFHIDVMDPAGNPLPYFAAEHFLRQGNLHAFDCAGNQRSPRHLPLQNPRRAERKNGRIGDLVKEGVEYGGLKFELKTN